MAQFTYECPECHERWTEDRDRNDEYLDFGRNLCPNDCSMMCHIERDAPRCNEGCKPAVGFRVFDPGNVAVVFKGIGWAAKDRYAQAND